MLTGTRSQIVGPAAVVASNGTGRVVPTAVSVEPRGELAGGPGETGPISQALRPRKLTVEEPRRTMEPRIQSNRWSWLAGGSSRAHPATNRRPQGKGQRV